MSECGKVRTTRTARGLVRYEVRVWHRALGKEQVIRRDNSGLVQQRAQEKMRQWDEQWARKEAAERKRQEREALTRSAPILLPTATQPPAPPPAPVAVCDCSGDTLNCGDFGTHAAAQACFAYCIELGRGDIHRLDRDNNGIACESLP